MTNGQFDKSGGCCGVGAWQGRKTHLHLCVTEITEWRLRRQNVRLSQAGKLSFGKVRPRDCNMQRKPCNHLVTVTVFKRGTTQTTAAFFPLLHTNYLAVIP